jgi:hypothetical protein
MAVDDPAFVAPPLVMSKGATGNRPDLAGPYLNAWRARLGPARRSESTEVPKSGGYTGKSPKIKAFRPRLEWGMERPAGGQKQGGIGP